MKKPIRAIGRAIKYVFTTPIKGLHILGSGIDFGERKEPEKPKIYTPTPEETERYGKRYYKAGQSNHNTDYGRGGSGGCLVAASFWIGLAIAIALMI